MEMELIKALAKMPVKAVVAKAKKKVEEEVKYIGTKYIDDGIRSVTNKVNKDINNSVADIKTMPQQMALEFKKKSTHQSGQPFQRSFNNGNYYNQYDYFNDYYNKQKNRYSPTPQPNLAEILSIQESNMKSRHNPDTYINPKRY